MRRVADGTALTFLTSRSPSVEVAPPVPIRVERPRRGVRHRRSTASRVPRGC